MFERQGNKAVLHDIHMLESVQPGLEGLGGGGGGISHTPEDAVVLPGCCQEPCL